MEQWAVVLADGLLLAVALGGGLFTVLRARLGTRARMLAVGACVLVSAAMLFQLVWWLLVVPASHSSAEIAGGAGRSDVGSLLTGVVVAAAVGMLFAALIVGAREGPPAPTGPSAPRQRSTPPTHHAPAAHHAPAHHPAANGHAPRPPATAGAQAGPSAGGWSPPQQSQPNDWNIMSGVWSIPRGTFDGPPPEDPGRR